MSDEGNGAPMFWTFLGAFATAAFAFAIKFVPQKWKRDDAKEDRLWERADKGPRKDLKDCLQRELVLTRDLARVQEQVIGLQREKERIQSIGVTANVECSTDGKITDFDHNAELMFGWSTPEAIGDHVEILIPHRMRGEHEAAFQLWVKGEGVVQPDGAARDLPDVFALTKDGKEIRVAIRLTSYRRNGELRCLAQFVHVVRSQ